LLGHGAGLLFTQVLSRSRLESNPLPWQRGSMLGRVATGLN
jgi:hypothetical protein